MKKNLTIKKKIVLSSLMILLFVSCSDDNKGEKVVVENEKNSIEESAYLEETANLKAVGSEEANSGTISESEVSYTGSLSDDL